MFKCMSIKAQRVPDPNLTPAGFSKYPNPNFRVFEKSGFPGFSGFKTPLMAILIFLVFPNFSYQFSFFDAHSESYQIRKE